MKYLTPVCSRIYTAFLISFVWLSIHAQPDTNKANLTVVFKTARLYKGVAVESVIPNADHTNAVVKTTDGHSYTLTREEIKQAFDITLTDKGWITPRDASVVYLDQNGVPGESYNNYDVISSNKMETGGFFLESQRGFGMTKDSIHQPLYIIDGKEAVGADIHQLNPRDIKRMDVLKGEKAITTYGAKGKNGVIIITTKETSKDTTSAKIEGSAIFPGGITAWRKYLERNLHYPTAAQKNNTQGVVRVQMTVENDGKISNVTAMNDPGDGLANEAVRVIKEGPDWVPATQNGKPVTYKFVQTITFRMATSTLGYINPNRFNQSIVIKTKRLYKGQTISNITTTEDLSGVDVLTADMKSYFINRMEALQQLGLLITDSGFVAPEDAQVLYYDNNGVTTDNYHNLKFIGGTRNFRIPKLYLRGTKIIDNDKAPVFLINGKEATAEEVQKLNPRTIWGSNLLKLQDEPAIAQLGSKGKNGVLILSTKLRYPDNYLYLLDGKETTNEELAKLDPRTMDSMISSTGGRALDMYGEKAKYGLVRYITKKKDATNRSEPIFSNATTPATFPGGDEGWKKYLAANLRYPESARKNNVEGTVRVRVIIAPDGSVSKAVAANDPGNGLAQEAVRLLKEGPTWTPAKCASQNVTYTLMMSVIFKQETTNYF